MTAVHEAEMRWPDAETSERRWSPEEGWSVVALVAILGLILATAIDEPAWVNGRGALTDCLAEMALLGSLVGFAGPKLGWGRWTTHLVGAVFAGLLIPIIAGWAVLPGISPAQAFRLTANGTLEAYLDLTVRSLEFTTQEVHYVLVLGGLVWGTMQFGSYAVFGHRRPLSAVVVVGLVLLANMALTIRDQLGLLVLYTAVSLFLLIQMHAFGERLTWARRRIGDPGSIAFVYLRGGTVFIVLAMVGSLVLTQRAASSPLAGAWGGLRNQLIQIGEQVGRLFPTGGDLRGGGGVSFGSSARISAQWFSDDGVAFTAKVPPTAAGLSWRAATYDQFALGGWIQSDARTADVPADSSLLLGSPEVPAPDLYGKLSVTVSPVGYHDTRVLTPGLASTVGLPSTLAISGVEGWFAYDDVPPDSAYTATALVPLLTGETGITKNKLRAASTVYPADVTAEYTEVPTGAMGPYAQELLRTLMAKSPSKNPYDLADTIQQYLRNGPFTYTTDVRGVNCQSASAVECFAQYRQGYCLHYASTMAILLRAANPANPIPTRLVQGFLPSGIVGGQEVVQNRQAHAWVEVFFPGYGWIPFDPTGGGVGRPAPIQEGAPVPSAAPVPSQDEGPVKPVPTARAYIPGDPPGVVPPPTSSQPGDRAMAALIGGLLLLAIGSLIAVAWWRGPRGEVSPETAWTAVSSAASRFGFAQRPTETVYEYADSIGELVPVARPDIRTVADAKVETTYARVQLAPEREQAVAAAMRRLRLSLTRLIFARIGRRRRG
jgi:transglutaminase-like putative cysteine protease